MGLRNRIRRCLLMLTIFSIGALAGTQAIAADEDRMPDLDSSQKGKLQITVTAPDEKNNPVALEGLTLEIVPVAEASVSGGSVEYKLTEAFSAAGIEFDGMTAAQSNEYAAKLLEIVDKSNLTGISGVTDTNGQVQFSNLEHAMYLIRQKAKTDKTADFFDMSPFLVMVPEILKGNPNLWNYEVKALPKVEIGHTEKKEEGTGVITVTKKTALMNAKEDIPMYAEDATFYVGLFTDEKGENLYENNYKPIHFKSSCSETVSFEKLPYGIYYVFETDAGGKALPVKTAIEGKEGQFVCTFDNDQQKVEVKESEEYKVGLTNGYIDVPIGFYFEGSIDIYKYVRDEKDKEIKVKEPFYAGIFVKNEAGEEELLSVTELVQNDKVTVTMALATDASDSVEYWIYETDVKGEKIDKDSFAYKVTGESSVVLNMESLVGKVEITNKKILETEESKEEDGNGSKFYGGSSGSGVKTGDNTPIMMYIILLIIAAVVIILQVVFRKIRTK